jgi:hypothetical protein
MPATGIALLLFVLATGLGIAAAVRRSRTLGLLAAASFAVFLVYGGLLTLAIIQMD